VVSFHQVFPPKHLYTPLLSPMCATCSTHLILLYWITRTIFGEQYRSLNSSLSCFLHPAVALSLLGPNILLSTVLSNTLSLHSSLIVSDQFSHPYKATGKIIVLYILILKFLYSNLESRESAPNDSKLCLIQSAPNDSKLCLIQSALNFFMNEF